MTLPVYIHGLNIHCTSLSQQALAGKEGPGLSFSVARSSSRRRSEPEQQRSHSLLRDNHLSSRFVLAGLFAVGWQAGSCPCWISLSCFVLAF